MPIVSDYLYAKASKNKIPLSGTFELSPVCNFSCKMCYVRKTNEQLKSEGKSIRHWTEWLELGKQCKEAGTLFLLLTGGEPFIYPGFRELYEALHKLGIVLSINTNGTLIDEETVDWLKTMAPSRMNITLYGSSSDTYKCLCGNPDGYEKAKKSILMLKEAGIPVVVNASMIPENADDMKDIIDFSKENHLNIRMTTYMFPPVRRDAEECDSRFTAEQAADMFIKRVKYQLDDEKYVETLKDYINRINSDFDINDEDSWGDNLEYMRCRAGRSTFWVSWEGELTACGMMPFPVKKYPFEEPFSNCWNELTETVRRTKVMDDCNKCEKKEICKPCVAMLHAETGGVAKKAPYLCEMTDQIIARVKEELQELEILDTNKKII